MKTTNIPALTGLRFIAALLVYLCHAGVPAWMPAPFHQFASSGKMGVTLFFVLSGFVLTLRYGDELAHPTTRKLWNYSVARVARIWPLYLVMLGYVIARYWYYGIPIRGWITHVFALQVWNSDAVYVVFGFNAPGWSIGVEVFLYACFPIIIYGVARIRSLKMIVMGMALTAAVLAVISLWLFASRGGIDWVDGRSANRWLYRSPFMRVFDFTLGVLAARLYVGLKGKSFRFGGVVATLSSVGVGYLMTSRSFFDTALSFDVAYAIPVVFVIVGLTLSPRSLLSRVLGSKPLVVLGEASFALYLVHAQILERTVAWEHTTGTYLAVMAMAVVASLLLHRLIENPAQRGVYHLLAVRRTLRTGHPTNRRIRSYLVHQA